MKAARTSLKTFSKQSFTDDGRVPVGGDLPHGHAHRFRLDPTLRGAREGLVGAYGRLWSVGDVPQLAVVLLSLPLKSCGWDLAAAAAS
jgi:hypothetical protein